mmetsp:Transcript_4085/g.15371  ORF Transcript_4085/g.15371 Transcript_4085/m.15371 type:complete len:340 (+) Transcript_4085:11436-12455(+)
MSKCQGWCNCPCPLSTPKMNATHQNSTAQNNLLGGTVLCICTHQGHHRFPCRCRQENRLPKMRDSFRSKLDAGTDHLHSPPGMSRCQIEYTFHVWSIHRHLWMLLQNTLHSGNCHQNTKRWSMCNCWLLCTSRDPSKRTDYSCFHRSSCNLGSIVRSILRSTNKCRERHTNHAPNTLCSSHCPKYCYNRNTHNLESHIPIHNYTGWLPHMNRVPNMSMDRIVPCQNKWTRCTEDQSIHLDRCMYLLLSMHHSPSTLIQSYLRCRSRCKPHSWLPYRLKSSCRCLHCRKCRALNKPEDPLMRAHCKWRTDSMFQNILRCKCKFWCLHKCLWSCTPLDLSH